MDRYSLQLLRCRMERSSQVVLTVVFDTTVAKNDDRILQTYYKMMLQSKTTLMEYIFRYFLDADYCTHPDGVRGLVPVLATLFTHSFGIS